MTLKSPKRYRWECGLCGNPRYVEKQPKSNCICVIDFPNRHMSLKYIWYDFWLWLGQRIKLSYTPKWRKMEKEGMTEILT